MLITRLDRQVSIIQREIRRMRRWRSPIHVLKAKWVPIVAIVVCMSAVDIHRCNSFVLPRPTMTRSMNCQSTSISSSSRLQQQHTRLSSQRRADDGRVSNIQAVEKAEALRRRARALAAEAEAAESKLRNETLARKNQRDAELDDFIDDLVAVVAVTNINQTDIGRTINGRSVKEDVLDKRRVDAILTKLRSASDSVTTTRLLRVVERIHERERLASSAVDWVDTTLSGNVKKNNSEDDLKKTAQGAGLGGLAHSLVEAVALLEQERNVKTPESLVNDEKANENRRLGADGNERQKRVNRPRRRFGIAPDAAPKLRARMKELRRADEEMLKRNFAALSNLLRRGINSTDANVRKEGHTISWLEETFAANNLRKSNGTNFVQNIIDVPLWLPNSIIPFVLLDGEQLEKNDTKRFREEVLDGSLFFCTGWETQRYAALFRGNFVEKRKVGTGAASPASAKDQVGPAGENNASLVTKDLEHDRISRETFGNVQKRLASSDLGDRIQLFLLQDPEDKTDDESEARPAFLAIPASIRPSRSAEYRFGTKVGIKVRVVANTIWGSTTAFFTHFIIFFCYLYVDIH